ncbi:putative leucine-rich repeat receptor-like protein kinase [Canna indica]|uniref:Leucine-rich repeat receptor-like protein kinase n=1 Tax=Canna indica TaxID=4628 RepID=A0AAQ3Q653_9LILI|nr:putative leucine-rich repeat receptor-like protein kinase [Canna indica]
MELGLLNLRSNAFTGNIPQLSLLASLQILDISNNNLSGTIPWNLGNLSAMKTSIWSEDFYKHGISNDLWLFMKGNEYEYKKLSLGFVKYIDLSNNDLFEDIPEELGSLHGLQNLNLSRNHLTGTISWSIDGMQRLEVLDLSINNLSDAIPSSLAFLYSLNHLNLSYNNLSGRIPTGNQLQTFTDPSIYAGNPYLCGRPLGKNCTQNVTKGEEKEDANEKIEVIWLYTSIALGFIIGFWTIRGTLILKRKWRFIFCRVIDKLYDKLHAMIIVNMRKFRRE